MNKIEQTAREWVEKGHSVIPVFYRSKRPMVKWESLKTSLPTDAEIKQWFPVEMRNLALITGHENLLVIDFDIQEVFNFWYKENPIETYMVKTARGVHVYLQTAEKASNCHTRLLDIKAERGYVLIPPSVHPSGYQYQVLKNAPILKIEKLSDVLPAYYTPKPEPIAEIGIKPIKPEINDPWEIAFSAQEINADLIRKIRETVSILSFFPSAEATSRDNRWFVSSCPFHHDSNPSFWIDTKRGICGCRKCNIKEMDVINLYARMHSVSNRDAILELAKKL